MVPAEGAHAEGRAAGAEPIGHVPGPAEGVYGDPPVTGGTVDPEQRGWEYDTGYFFALTRGLKDSTDLSPVGRRWVRPWTLTFDVFTLPTAALAGLSGRAPTDGEPEDATETTSESEPADGDDSTDAPAEPPPAA